jgi:hypothetical protein
MFESDIQLKAGLPSLGKYTIGNDFASIMINQILTQRPRLIVEAGSGVSTILAAYCFEQLGHGILRSLEHLVEYANETKNMIRQHKLETVDAKIIFSPLRQYEICGEDYLWYSMNKLDIPTQIDMLIVDGPPRLTGKLARYPILPLLYEKLSTSATILLDDANRLDESEIVDRWLHEYPNLRSQRFATEKGAVLFSLSC